MTENPIIIFHGWSDQAKSFDRLAGLLRTSLNREIKEIFLVDWLSLDDEVTYVDFTVALQRAWGGGKGLSHAKRVTRVAFDRIQHNIIACPKNDKTYGLTPPLRVELTSNLLHSFNLCELPVSSVKYLKDFLLKY